MHEHEQEKKENKSVTIVVDIVKFKILSRIICGYICVSVAFSFIFAMYTPFFFLKLFSLKLKQEKIKAYLR